MPRDSPAPYTPTIQPHFEMPIEEDNVSEMSDDVWGDDGGAQPSEVEGLRRQHTTEGYRDGVTVGKEESVQKGFDEGYNIGALFGLRIGWLAGALNGLLRVAELSEDDKEAGGVEVEGNHVSSVTERVKHLQRAFTEETALEKLFSQDYFDDKAVWSYPVETENAGHSQQDEEDTYTFDDVVASHPFIKKWTETVISLAKDLSLDLELPRRSYETKDEATTQ